MSNWIKKYGMLVLSLTSLLAGILSLSFACHARDVVESRSKSVTAGTSTGYVSIPNKSKPKPPSVRFYDSRSQLPDIAIEPDDIRDWAFQGAGLALYYALYDLWLEDPKFVENAFKKHGFKFTVTLPYEETHRKPA